MEVHYFIPMKVIIKEIPWLAKQNRCNKHINPVVTMKLHEEWWIYIETFHLLKWFNAWMELATKRREIKMYHYYLNTNKIVHQR